MYSEIIHTYIHTHSSMQQQLMEKDGMDLLKSKKGNMGGFQGRKGRRNEVIIL